jgi:hypothetical protein
MEDEQTGLKDSVLSSASQEADRLARSSIPSIMNDLYFSKCCSVYYIVMSLACISLLIICCIEFQYTNCTSLISIYVVPIY